MSAASTARSAQSSHRLGVDWAQQGNFVAQDEQLDILRRRGPAEQLQPAENPNEDQVKQMQRHDA
jgi:hypothetical protein